MAKISIESGKLVITMTGLRRLWTLKRQLTFPLTSVRSVSHGPDVRRSFPKFWEKRMGTNLPRTYYGGTFSQHGEKVFWDVRKPTNGVVITLANEKYQRLIVDVDNPKKTVKAIKRAINRVV